MRRVKNTCLRFKRVWGIAIALGFVIIILPAFSFSQETDETSITSRPPDIEIFMKNGIYRWVENNPYMKKLAATRSWKDLPLSAQFISLSTMGVQLEQQTGIHLGTDFINEMLDAPVEISIWNMFDNEKENAYVFVMDVAPKYRALFKLVEVYAQALKKTSIEDINNIKILKTQWLDNTLFHMMINYQLVISNHRDSLLYIIEKAKKSGPIQTFRDSEFYKKNHQNQEGNFKCRIDMGRWFENIKGLMNKNEMQLAVNMDLAETVNFYSLFLHADPGFKSSQSSSLEDCREFIPRETILAFTGLYNPGFYINMTESLPNFIELSSQLDLEPAKDIGPFFKESFFFYITGLQNKTNPNVVNGVMGFALEKCKPAQKQKIIDFIEALMTPPDSEMSVEKYNKKGDIQVYRFQDAGAPAFCMLDKWLLVGTGYESLRQCLAVYDKKIPNISDGKGYRKLAKSFAKNGFLQAMVEPSVLCKSLVDHLLFIAHGFGPADVKLKIQPAADIFATIPTFGVFFELQNDILVGKVEFPGK